MIVIIKVMSGEMLIGKVEKFPVLSNKTTVALERPKVFAMGMTREGGMAIQMPDLFSVISDEQTIEFNGVEWVVEATQDIAENYQQSLSPIAVPPAKKLELV
jgi:hypothetical protein